jgi:TolB-like protein
MNRDRRSLSSPELPGREANLQLDEVPSALEKLLASRTFRSAQGQRRFLAYAAGEVLAGRAHLLKEYVIGTEALGRDASFDPRLDPIVRTEARKLRLRLAKYYQGEGSGDALRIELPKGSYVPVFHSFTEQKTAPALDVTHDSSPAPALEETLAAAPRHPAWKLGALVLSALLLIALSSAALLDRLSRPSSTQDAWGPHDVSIAVLPLVNLNGNTDDLVGKALTDELIHSLTQIPGLDVVARTSAFRLASQRMNVRPIDQLPVAAILVGTVSRAGDRLKVSVQLNNAANGYHLWSGDYEQESQTVSTLPQAIASAVTNVLGMAAPRTNADAAFPLTGTPNSEAQEDYLRALYFRNKFTVESLNTAIDYYKRALFEDPSFARAYAGLADCYALERPVAAGSPLEMKPKIKTISLKALELNPKLGEPHIDLAISAEYEFDWATADREFKKGLELSPGNVLGHIWYAWYLSLVGRNPEALLQKNIASRLDPVSPYALDALGYYYFTVGRYDAAVQHYRSSLALEPGFGLTHQDLGDAYLFEGACPDAIEELRLANLRMPGPRRLAHLGYAYGVCRHTTEAREILHDFLNQPHRSPVPALAIAELYLGLGDKDRALPWIEKAIDERDLELNLQVDPHFRCFRSDARYKELLRRMRLS